MTETLADRIVIPAAAGIRDIKVLKADLDARLASRSNVEIDASAIEQTDFSFLQLLVSGFRTFTAEGLGFRLSESSPPLTLALQRAGIPNAAVGMPHGLE